MSEQKFVFTEKEWEESERAYAEFHNAYGIALAQWAGLERMLSYWFALITQMHAMMAQSVFYSARSFGARAEMLQAAIEHAKHIQPDILKFIQAALKRCWSYSTFRNYLAHGEPSMTVMEVEGRPRKVYYAIVQTGSSNDTKTEISVEQLKVIAENFNALHMVMMDAHPKIGPERAQPRKSILEYLARVNALPTQANSKSNPKPSGPGSPSQPGERVNKKAHREAQRQKRPEGG